VGGPAVVALALSLPLTGCAEVGDTSSAGGYSPAKLAAAGSGDLQRVTFTPDAAARVDLQTDTAARVGRHTVVDYAALIYDGQGESWVYTVPGPLTFLRAKVAVNRIEGDRVLIANGLAPGTRVVTVGATEVYGAELDIGGSH
jgi:hypothetical protein